MTARTARRASALGVMILLLATGCGDNGGGDGSSESFAEPSATGDDSSDSTADTAAGSDTAVACDLLTTEAVADLLGQPVTDGRGETVDGGSLCLWDTEASSQVVDGPITMSLELGELTDEAQADIQAELDDPANEVLDLGDAAVHVCGLGADGASCSALDNVLVAVGDQYLEVDLGNWGYPGDFEEDEGVAITEDAATQAVDALG